MIRFLHPEAASWLLILPVLWCCWLLHRWYRDQTRRVSGLGPRLTRLASMTGLKRDLAVAALATLAALALICAAARPQMTVRTPEYERIDLIVVLDRSASMRASDISPNRFSRAGLEIQNFLKTKPDTISRVGLIAFANTALVMSHLTRDSGILFFVLDWMKEDEEPFFGTDLAMALRSALTVAKKELPQRRKIVVLISDGDDHGEGLERAIGAFQENRIPVYCIGIGTDAEVPIPAPPGAEYAMLRDDDGTVLTTKFSENTLRRIAGMTGGRYFRSVTGLELSKTLADIAAREKRIAKWRYEYRDLHPYALAAAVSVLSGLLVIL